MRAAPLFRRLSALVLAMGLAGAGAPAAPTAAATVPIGCGPGRVTELITAITAANATPEADTIELAAGCTYTLTAAHNDTTGPNGLPSIGSPIAIHGNGAVIERAVAPGTPAFRLFHVAATGDLTLRGITVRNGRGPSDFSTSAALGGGIYVEGFSGAGGKLTVVGSTVSGNVARDGAGIYAQGAALTVVNSTVSGNRTLASLGEAPPGYVSQGGGIQNIFGEVVLRNSTITANDAGNGAGVYNLFGAGAYVNTVIAGNGASAFAGVQDCIANDLASGGHNLVGTGTGCPSNGPGDVAVPPATVVTEVLGPLADNGGPTRTHALLPNSPAIDAADDTTCTAAPVSAIDQRGVARPQDGDGDGAAHCDIGAYELQRAVVVTLALPTARPVAQIITGLSADQHILRIQNGQPGLRTLRITVNGRVLPIVTRLRDGEVRTLDVARSLRPGTTNSIKLETPWGTPGTIGGSAVIAIGP